LNRAEKERYVEDLRTRLEKARAAFMAEYSGIKATEMNEFRAWLREAATELRVVRNTLAKIAMTGTDKEPLTGQLEGPVAIAISYEDPALSAKRLMEFAKEKPGFKFRAAMLGPKLLGAEDIKALAELPSRDVLLAKVVGSMTSPLAGLVGVLAGVERKLLNVLNAVREKKAQQGRDI